MRTAPNSDERNLGLDLVRGICAAGVAGYHHTSWTYGIAIESIGAFAVYAFFILSATTMMLVYAPMFHEGITRQQAVTFYRNRAARIMPLLTLTSAITFLWLLSRGAPLWINWQKALLTATGAFSFGTPGLLSGVTGAWSLGIEIVFYAIFPVVALFTQSASVRSLAWFLLGALVAQHLAMSLLWSFDILQLWYNYATPLVFAPYIIMGIIIFRLEAGKSLRWLFVCIGALLLVFSFSIFSDVDLYRSSVWHLYLSILIGIMVWAAYRSEVPGMLGRLAIFLGEISYALYLTHFLANWLAGLVVGDEHRPQKSLIFAVLAVAISYAVYVYFERPLRRFFRHPGAMREASLNATAWFAGNFKRI